MLCPQCRELLAEAHIGSKYSLTCQECKWSKTVNLQAENNECPDPNVQAVIDSHLRRAGAGKKKYGVDTTRDDLTDIEWLNHYREELMDAAIYAQRMIEDRRMGGMDNATIQAFLRQHTNSSETHEELLSKFSEFVRSREVRVGSSFAMKPITVPELLEMVQGICKDLRKVGLSEILRGNRNLHNFNGGIVDNDLVDAVMVTILCEISRAQNSDLEFNVASLDI
jgi:hypothetical protein